MPSISNSSFDVAASAAAASAMDSAEEYNNRGVLLGVGWSEFYSCQFHDEDDGIAMMTSGRDYPHDMSCIPSLAKGDCRVSLLSGYYLQIG